MIRKRILFVDDEQQVLIALQRVLRRDTERWDMVFVSGGEAALHELRALPFDMIVTDMCMPVLDGVTLLEHVQRESPRTIRLMLSGSADQETIARAGGLIEQLLCKPCPTATLRSTIETWLERANLDVAPCYVVGST